MPKRLTVPDDHVGLVLSNQLADELSALLRQIRRHNRKGYERVRKTNSSEEERAHGVTDLHMEEYQRYAVAGDILLAILEAKE